MEKILQRLLKARKAEAALRAAFLVSLSPSKKVLWKQTHKLKCATLQGVALRASSYCK